MLTNCNMYVSSKWDMRATLFLRSASSILVSNQYRVFIIYNTQRVPNLQYQLSNIWPSISLMKFCRGVQNKEVHHNKNGNKVMSIFQFLFLHFYSHNKAFIVVNHNHSLISLWSDITLRYRIMVHINRVHFTYPYNVFTLFQFLFVQQIETSRNNNYCKVLLLLTKRYIPHEYFHPYLDNVFRGWFLSVLGVGCKKIIYVI